MSYSVSNLAVVIALGVLAIAYVIAYLFIKFRRVKNLLESLPKDPDKMAKELKKEIKLIKNPTNNYLLISIEKTLTHSDYLSRVNIVFFTFFSLELILITISYSLNYLGNPYLLAPLILFPLLIAYVVNEILKPLKSGLYG